MVENGGARRTPALSPLGPAALATRRRHPGWPTRSMRRRPRWASAGTTSTSTCGPSWGSWGGAGASSSQRSRSPAGSTRTPPGRST